VYNLCEKPGVLQAKILFTSPCYENLLSYLSLIHFFNWNSKFESHLHSYQSATMKVTFLVPTKVFFSGSKIGAVYAKDRLQRMLCVIRRGSKMLLNCIGNDAQKIILSTEFSRIPFIQKLIIKRSQFFCNLGQIIPSLGISAWVALYICSDSLILSCVWTSLNPAIII
jgi:hypothetical protein